MTMKKEVIPQKPLTREQVKHAKLRIEQVAKRKADAIGEVRKWNTDAAVGLLEQELRAGRFTIPPKVDLRGMAVSAPFYKVLKFDRFPNGVEDARKVVDADNHDAGVRRAKIEAEAARIIDDLILGDAHEALAAIRAFEAKSF